MQVVQITKSCLYGSCYRNKNGEMQINNLTIWTVKTADMCPVLLFAYPPIKHQLGIEMVDTFTVLTEVLLSHFLLSFPTIFSLNVVTHPFFSPTCPRCFGTSCYLFAITVIAAPQGSLCSHGFSLGWLQRLAAHTSSPDAQKLVCTKSQKWLGYYV